MLAIAAGEILASCTLPLFVSALNTGPPVIPALNSHRFRAATGHNRPGTLAIKTVRPRPSWSVLLREIWTTAVLPDLDLLVFHCSQLGAAEGAGKTDQKDSRIADVFRRLTERRDDRRQIAMGQGAHTALRLTVPATDSPKD
jgi:hypothetical protein